MFFLMQDLDLAIAQIPRCAIGTIIDWLGPSLIIVQNNDQRLQTITKKVAFVRDPIDRLKSAFSLFYWMKENYNQVHVSNAPTDSWENFIDFSLSAIPDNEHWKPQSILTEGIPNIYHKLENLYLHFETYRPGILQHYNRTTRSPLITAETDTDKYRLTELNQKYADDLILYNGAS